jgi:hypothetical protein
MTAAQFAIGKCLRRNLQWANACRAIDNGQRLGLHTLPIANCELPIEFAYCELPIAY